MVRGPAGCSLCCTLEPQGHHVRIVDEGINDSNRVVLCDEVIQALWQQCDLMPVLSLDVSGHIDLGVQYVARLYWRTRQAARGFSHSLQRLLSVGLLNLCHFRRWLIN